MLLVDLGSAVDGLFIRSIASGMLLAACGPVVMDNDLLRCEGMIAGCGNDLWHKTSASSFFLLF